MIRNSVTMIAVAVLTLVGWAGAQDIDDGPELRARRLYFGAPPAAPHDTGGFMSDCLVCHGPSSFAPETPHPTRRACRQCHASAAAAVAPFRASQFAGLTRPPRSERVQPLAPPLIAHPILLHENCLACHAPGARQEIIPTSHPERIRCRQCHVPGRAGAPGLAPRD